MAYPQSPEMIDADRGSIMCGIDAWLYYLKPGAEGSILTVCSNADDGTGLAWVAPYALPSAITATSVVLTGGIAVNGVASPPAQAALPTTLDQAITILTNLGFCASS